MGYNLYITRAGDWLDAAENPIHEEEWLALVDDDASLSVNGDDYYERQTPDGQLERLHPVEWSEADDGNCFWYDGGAIECKNPSEAWIAKMVEIAQRLGARGVGDEGEEYH